MSRIQALRGAEASFIASQVPQCHGNAHVADLQARFFLQILGEMWVNKLGEVTRHYHVWRFFVQSECAIIHKMCVENDSNSPQGVNKWLHMVVSPANMRL